MGCFAEAGYLASIVLIEEGITSQEKAISGQEIIGRIKARAPAYFNWIGEEKLKGRLWVTLQLADCPYDPEHPLTDDPFYANLARDTKIDFGDPKLDYYGIIYGSKYWMQNGDRKGAIFMGGLSEEHLASYFRENKRDRQWYAIEDIGAIRNDTDLWAFVNTWLEKNWR